MADEAQNEEPAPEAGVTLRLVRAESSWAIYREVMEILFGPEESDKAA